MHQELLGSIQKEAFLSELAAMATSAAKKMTIPAREVVSTLVRQPGIKQVTERTGMGALSFVGKPGIKRNLQHNLESVLKGVEPTRQEVAGELPEGAVRAARKIADSLRSQGIDPTKARIAVSGAGGTGKTTMSRALSQELNMKHVHLDSHRQAQHLYSTRGIDKYEPPKGSISEQTHLINRVDPEKFDVVIHMSADPKVVEKQIMARGRGAYQVDVYDYNKLKKSLQTSFDSMQGTKLTPVKGTEVKIKGPGGFGSRAQLESEARKRGIVSRDLAGRPMTRQQLVNSVSTGRAEVLDGILPYVKPDVLEGLIQAPGFTSFLV